MTTNRKQKPNRLTLYRKRMGFSQKRVARLLGHKDTSMLSHYEHARSFPPLPVALRLGAILRVPLEFLWEGLYCELRVEIRRQEELLAGRGQQMLF